MQNKHDETPIFVTRSFMPPYDEYIEAIKPLWESCRITNLGKYHKELESELKKYLETDELSLLVNGHMALELFIQAMNFPEGSEVITTPYTFISTTHAIIRNHLTPVFCDVRLDDGTMDAEKIECLITEKTVAIIPVHVYGYVCQVNKISQIAAKYHLKVIYDAAHAFGVKYCGKGIATYGDGVIFSFHATKIYHTIEGGAAAFHDHELYKKLYNLKNFGIQGEEIVTDIGANAKMNEFSAIMGLCNLKYIEKEIYRRKQIDAEYREKLNRVKGIRLFKEQSEVQSNYAYFPIIVEEDYKDTRDELYTRMKSQNIHVRKYFYPITCEQICYNGKYKNVDVENAKYLSRHILTLPMYGELQERDIERICEILKN